MVASQPPNAVFVGYNHRYINPTNAYIPAIAGRSFTVHCYGPGYVSAATLERGLERFVDAIGGVEVILTTHTFCAGYEAEALNRFASKFAVRLNGGSIAAAFVRDVSAYLKQMSARVLCYLTEMDPHAVQASILDRLEAHAQYFVGWGPGFINTLGDRQAVEREGYLQKRIRRSIPLGLFDGFVERHARRFINLGHAVADNEFYWGSLSVREYDAVVPGSQYARRRDALRALRQSSAIRVAPLGYRRMYQAADRLGLRPFARFYGVHVYNLAFQRALSRSRVCITDGGANNYPVRKFFEIPAAGAVMVCWPSEGLERLGFRNGVDCIFVRSESEAVDAVRGVAASPERFEAVAAAGRELVLRAHSIDARSSQMERALAEIVAGRFNGSSWDHGTFRLASQDSQAVTAEMRR